MLVTLARRLNNKGSDIAGVLLIKPAPLESSDGVIADLVSLGRNLDGEVDLLAVRDVGLSIVHSQLIRD